MGTLEGRIAVVTGGGRGIGRGVAHALARDGAAVVAVARSAQDVEETARGATGPGRVSGRTCDVADAPAVDGLFADVADELGAPDILVCCHGVYTGGTSLVDLPLKQYERTMAVNVRGSLLCVQAAARRMGAGGRIVLTSSMNALASQTGAVDYDTSKAALHGLVRAAALELAPSAITVNAVAPGWIRTPMSEGELDHLDADGLVVNPLGRVGSPADVALAVRWLVDPDNAYVTGTVVPVDGGQLAMLARPWKATPAR
jgi:3-oxoacyl-[acyl-carrier protein] reductase